VAGQRGEATQVGDRLSSKALAPWRKPRALHDPGKALLDVRFPRDAEGDMVQRGLGGGMHGPSPR
jgi:hypothetical protein